MTDHNGPLSTDAALAVLLDRTEAQGKTLDALTRNLESMSRAYVPRTEWEQRNRTVDERHQSDGREIAAEREERKRADDAIRAEMNSRRHPWPSVLAAVVAAAAFALALLNRAAM